MPSAPRVLVRTLRAIVDGAYATAAQARDALARLRRDLGKLRQPDELLNKPVAVSDVFQALAQRRPYRDPLSPDVIMGILDTMVSEGKLDRKVVSCVEENLLDCWRAAVGVPHAAGAHSTLVA